MESSSFRAAKAYDAARADLKLRKAVVAGAVQKVQRLIKSGVDVNTKDNQGHTVLHLAASHDHQEIAQLLIQEGADVNAQGEGGWTALLFAAGNVYPDMVELLLANGAHMDHQRDDGITPLMLAATADSLLVAEMLIHAGADLGLPDPDGNTALLMAIRCGSVPMAELILDSATTQDHGVVNAVDNEGFGALHLAVQSMDESMVALLLKHGAPLEAKVSGSGTTALLMASDAGCLSIVKLLVKAGAQIDAQNLKGRTALHIAVEQGDEDVCLWLIRRGADINATDSKLCTPLHLAIGSAKLSMVQMLLDRRASMRARDARGRSSLHLAVLAHNAELVKLLLAHGATVSAMDEDNMTALQLACKNNQIECVALLLEHGSLVEDALPFGMTAMHLASMHDHVDIVRLLLDQRPSCDLLTTDQGKTPLQVAIETGSTQVILLLLSRGRPYSPQTLQLLLHPQLLRRLRDQNPLDCPLDRPAFLDVLLERAMPGQLFEPIPSLQTKVLRQVRDWVADEAYSDESLLAVVTDFLPICMPQWTPVLVHSLACCNLQRGIRLKTLRPEQAGEGNDFRSQLFMALQNANYLASYIEAESNFETLEKCTPQLTPLLVALFDENRPLAKLLLGAGANVQLPHSSGDTPLHLAISKRDIGWVRLLLEFGARHDVPNLHGLTPLDLAAQLGLHEIEALLRKT